MHGLTFFVMLTYIHVLKSFRANGDSFGGILFGSGVEGNLAFGADHEAGSFAEKGTR
jgi:hypothetical protein